MKVIIRNTLSPKYTYYALIYSPNKYLLSIDFCRWPNSRELEHKCGQRQNHECYILEGLIDTRLQLKRTHNT